MMRLLPGFAFGDSSANSSVLETSIIPNIKFLSNVIILKGQKLEAASGTVKRPILKVEALRKVHQTASQELTVLKDVNLSLEEGDTLAIIGPSGSGKTTLLGLCAGLDDASGGSVALDGQGIESMSQDERAALRNRLVGFVFQSFQLIPTLTAIENVLVPLELRGEPGRQGEAEELAKRGRSW